MSLQTRVNKSTECNGGGTAVPPVTQCLIITEHEIYV